MTRLQGPPVAPLPPPLQGQSPTPLFIVFHRFCVLCGAGTGNLSSQPSQPVYGSHTRIVSFFAWFSILHIERKQEEKGLQGPGLCANQAMSLWFAVCGDPSPSRPVLSPQELDFAGPDFQEKKFWDDMGLRLLLDLHTSLPPTPEKSMRSTSLSVSSVLFNHLRQDRDLGRATLGKQSVSIFNVSPNVPKFFFIKKIG